MNQILVANRPAAAWVLVRAIRVGLELGSQRLLDATSLVGREYNLSTADLAFLQPFPVTVLKPQRPSWLYSNPLIHGIPEPDHLLFS